MIFSFFSIFFSKIKFEGNTMDQIQIFDQLVPFNKPANKAFSLEGLYHHFNFGLSYRVVCCQNFAFLNRYHDILCEGRNSIKYITIPQLEVDVYASLNVTNWSKFLTSFMELLSDSILDKKNDKKKTYFIVENPCYIPL